MDNTETGATLGAQDTEWRQTHLDICLAISFTRRGFRAYEKSLKILKG